MKSSIDSQTGGFCALRKSSERPVVNGDTHVGIKKIYIVFKVQNGFE